MKINSKILRRLKREHWHTNDYSCTSANLFGLGYVSNEEVNKGVTWESFMGIMTSMKKIEMKIRPMSGKISICTPCWHPFISLPSTDCYSERNIDYSGADMNNGLNNRQNDAEACRSSCKSEAGAQFFAWVGPSYPDSNIQNTCWCKSSDSDRQDSVGVTAGNVMCGNIPGDVEIQSQTHSQS